MTKGTKIRALIALIALVNQALVTIGTVDFGNEISNQIYKWISLLFLIAAMVTSHWYNNDYTPEARIGTGVTRQLKAEKAEDYIGDYFFEEEEEGEADDEQDDI